MINLSQEKAQLA